MKLSQEDILKLRQSQTLTVQCDNAAEWESAKRVAQYVKSRTKRDDGLTYKVRQSSKDLTVSVTLMKE